MLCGFIKKRAETPVNGQDGYDSEQKGEQPSISNPPL
jgi:hypothetical protein